MVIIQHGDRLQVRSVPGSASRVMMDLAANGSVITGTWSEETSPDGYYQGAVYHGAIQLLLEPTGRKMTGKWVGFGKDFDVNTGPWTLRLVSDDIGKAALARYSRRPEPAAGPESGGRRLICNGLGVLAHVRARGAEISVACERRCLVPLCSCSYLRRDPTSSCVDY